MKKEIFFITFSVLLIILSAWCLYQYVHYKFGEFNCSGDFYVTVSNDEFDGTVTYDIQDDSAVVKISGLVTEDAKHYTFNREIKSSLHKEHGLFLLKSDKITKFKTDNVNDVDAENILPWFFIYKGEYFSLRIKRFIDGSLFYTSNFPLLYCAYNKTR